MEEEKQGIEKKVMVAIDERQCSYHALMWVLENLKESVTNSPLFIFAAQPLPKCGLLTFGAQLGFAHMYYPDSASADLVQCIKEQNKKVSVALLEKARCICMSQGVKVETVTEAGDPKEAICEAVEKYNINLLVVGDQADGFLQRAFQESLSSYLVKTAKCPVLVVRGTNV